MCTLAFLAALVLVCPVALSAQGFTTMDSGFSMRVSTRLMSQESGDVLTRGPWPSNTGIWFEVIRDADGLVIDQGWVPGTDSGSQHTSPTVGYDRWTRQAIVVWSRGYQEDTDLYMALYGEEGWKGVRPLTHDSFADFYPVLAVDDLARIHIVWWRPNLGGTVLYQMFHILSSGATLDNPEILDLNLDLSQGSVRFPYIGFQETTGLVYLAVAQERELIHLYRFSAEKGNIPTGGGSIVIPVSVAIPGANLGQGQSGQQFEAVQPRMTFVGDDEIPTVFWTEGDRLYFFYLKDNVDPSQVFSLKLELEYDPSGLEGLVQSLVLGRDGGSTSDFGEQAGSPFGWR